MSLELTTIGLKVFDPDDAGGTGSLRIQVSNGTLDATVGDSGLLITSGDQSGDIVLSGTMPDISRFFRGLSTGTLVYTTSVDGIKTFTVTITDNTNQAGTFSFQAEAFSFAEPVVVSPGATIRVDVGVAYDLTGDGFSVTDADESGETATCILEVDAGTLTITPGNSGVQVVSGNGTDYVELAGTIPAFSNLLAATGTGVISYLAASAGTPGFYVTVTDSGGYVGDGTVTLTVGAKPVVTAPAAVMSAIESVNYAVEGKGWSVTDADDAGGTATCLMQVSTGIVTIAVGNSGVTVTGGNASAAVTLTGTITQIRNLLDDTSTGTITYLKTSPATAFMSVTVTDSTTRAGSATKAINIADGTPTWLGFAQATPQRSQAITVNDFVFVADLSRLPQAWWDKVSADGRDIRVTSLTNTLYPRDLIRFDKDAQTGLIAFRFNYSTVSSQPVRIWVGAFAATAPTIDGTYGQQNTYSTNVRGFWPDGAGTDRTVYANDLTGMGTGFAAGGIAGPFGLATSYNNPRVAGVSQYAQTSINMPSTGLTAFHAYARLADANAWSQPILTLMGGHSNALQVSGGKLQAQSYDSTALKTYIATSNGKISTGTWWSVFAGFDVVNRRRVMNSNSSLTSNGLNSTNAAVSATAPTAFIVGGGGGTYSGSLSMVLWRVSISESDSLQFNYGWNAQLEQVTMWGNWLYTAETLTGL